MTKKTKEYIKNNMPYYGGIKRKYRYKEQVKDKAWSLLSDYVRCRDFVMYGTCVATGERIIDWRETDAGHFYTMAGHGALIGFSHLNIHMQKKISNKLSGASDGLYFAETLKDRYGKDILDTLRDMKNQTVKADDIYFLQKIKEVWSLFQELKAKYPNHNYPDYL